MHAGCVLVAGIPPSRTRMSASFESVQWNPRVLRLDLGLYSYPKEFLRNGVRTHVNSKGKIPSTGKIPLRGGSNPRRCIKQDSEPDTLPTELFRPHGYRRLHRLTNMCVSPRTPVLLCTSPLPPLLSTAVDGCCCHCLRSVVSVTVTVASLQCTRQRTCVYRGQWC